MNQSINPILSGIANWLLAMLAICLSFEFCHLCSWGLGASIVITPVFAYTLYYRGYPFGSTVFKRRHPLSK